MPSRIGQELNRQWGVGALHALYSKKGNWYHTLDRFPGALFDERGYVLFGTQQDYDNCSDLLRSKKQGKNWLYARHGIASLPGYKTYESGLFISPSEAPTTGEKRAELWEGGKATVIVNRYERDLKARQACIEIFGTSCSVCGFDFSKKYGKIGRGYIHVHHLEPLSSVEKNTGSIRGMICAQSARTATKCFTPGIPR